MILVSYIIHRALTIIGRTDYNCSPGASGGWSDLIPLYNLRDVVQVRNSSGQLVEAVVYGGAQFVGTGGNVITIPNSSNLTMFRRASHTTWTATDPCSNSRPTPGLANDLVNDTFIKELSHVDVSSLYLLPNPANTIINIVSDKDIETIVLMDITGKIVLTHQNNSDKSSQLNIESFNEGVHLVKVKYTDNSEEFKKFIKINK
ncbi:MAG: T9SS type A sorting domain-containing protein [Saprospiraceae bacterium]|nr:T9SS type A sorting domain-containing protein [Saprospiraceae bacterium]